MKIKIIGQQVSLVSKYQSVVDKSINSVPVECDFGPMWEPFSNRVLQIKQGGETYNVVLNNNKGFLPAEITMGDCQISVFGYNAAGNRLTTTMCNVQIQKSGFASSDDTPIPPTPDLYAQLLSQINTTESTTESYKTAAELSATQAAENAEIAIVKAGLATESADNASVSAVTAVKAMDVAVTKASEAGTSSTQSQQALTDLLAMMGTDIATLVGGKIPVSQIPSIATTEIYTVSSQALMDALIVQNGDICIRTDEDKSYIYNNGWVYLTSPTDYASRAGYAETAGTAENATMINGHRLVEMTAAEFATAVKDPNTYYLIG